jgi:predicted GNAT family N-acyltransferase
MPTQKLFDCFEVSHGSAEYDQTVALRDEVLRKPLGLKFEPQEFAQESDSFHLVCVREGELLGCLVLKPRSDRQIQMRQLAVREDRQGQGTGTALVAFSESFAAERGFDEMMLHARDFAVGFYEKLDYEAFGELFYEVTIPHRKMRKRLAPNRSTTP